MLIDNRILWRQDKSHCQPASAIDLSWCSVPHTHPQEPNPPVIYGMLTNCLLVQPSPVPGELIFCPQWLWLIRAGIQAAAQECLRQHVKVTRKRQSWTRLLELLNGFGTTAGHNKSRLQWHRAECGPELTATSQVLQSTVCYSVFHAAHLLEAK